MPVSTTVIQPPPLLGASLTGPSLLSPFPIVRLRGTISGSAVRITLLSVRAPVGSRITIRCSGPRRSCPRSQSIRITSRTLTRMRTFERKMRAGTVLRIFVTRPGLVGKYTRFTIRRGRPPARDDTCARPDLSVIACP